MKDLETVSSLYTAEGTKGLQCNAVMGSKNRALKDPSLGQKTHATDHTIAPFRHFFLLGIVRK